MTLKKSYKIIISVIIALILISSAVIYFYPHNDTRYYNNGKSIDVKYPSAYPSAALPFPFINYKYNVSSFSIYNNKILYLNSSIINPDVYVDAGDGGSTCFFMNISTHNINSKYADITFNGNDTPDFITYYNKSSSPVIISQNSFHITARALVGNCISVSIGHVASYRHNGYYNFTINISSGKLKNTYYITTEEHSAIYGFVQYPFNSSKAGYIDRINRQVMIENNNTSSMSVINIHNGYFYYFVRPDTGYKIYAINNNTSKLIVTIGNKTISGGGSKSYVIYSDEL